ncbi:perlucin-like protein [Ruditapes philippinarum]|uniref:perlucin-like protein n=1 Tax=Ruditapes philippinarum TaxID=129788 RepID=UPI00295B5B0C|nr:perlucin-like protein [Ruditapes philippinarum]
MKSNQFRFCLYCLVSCLSCAITVSENNNKNLKFARESDLDGFTCPEENTLYQKDKLSTSQCLARCADSAECFGVFLLRENSQCVGCNDKFLSSDNAPARLGTTFYRRRSYLIVEEAKTWADAKMHCSELGGHLLDIKSLEENTFIGSLITSRYLDSWLGATDIDEEGLFVWEEGSEVAKYFENWADGEPNNSRNKEHCVFISRNSHTWNDSPCYLQRSSVCEFD